MEWGGRFALILLPPLVPTLENISLIRIAPVAPL